MRETILKVLRQHFTQYNDYKLGKIADEIVLEIGIQKGVIGKTCSDCIHRETLMVTYIGDPPNLCQKGIPKGNAINCPYYEKDGMKVYGSRRNGISTYTFR